MAETNGTSSSLEKKVALLEAQLERLEAESEIRKLHHKYGYYLDKCLYKEVAALFADHPDTYVQFLNGKFKGHEGVQNLYVGYFSKRFVGGRNGPVRGFLLDHLIAQDIVDYDPETKIGKGRFRTLMSAGTHFTTRDHPGGQRQWWEGGIHENEYIKENGVWKILKLRYYPFWHGTNEHGWLHMQENYVPPFTKTGSAEEFGPDELMSDDQELWPNTRVVPFHYNHPVTDKPVSEIDSRAPVLGTKDEDAPKARPLLD